MKFKKKTYLKKFTLLSLATTSIFVLIVSYVFFLQVLNHDTYRSEVNSAVIKQRKIPASRGNIFDRNGVALTFNEYQNDLYMIPHYFHSDIQYICNVVKIDCAIIIPKIARFASNRILVAQNINDNAADELRQVQGLFVYRYPKRTYNLNSATQHIIGYVGRINRNMLETENNDSLYADDDIVGQSGLEYIYNRELHGINGAEQYVVMANGLELLNPNRFLSPGNVILESAAGNDLILSIDDRIQLVLANAIGTNKGAGVMLDIHSGAILAMYSSPSFDPKNVKSAFSSTDYPLMNRAINTYAPGSTFKLVTALAALELGIITPEDEFDCPGYYEFGGRAYHCWEHNGHGKLQLRDAIKRSCDVYFYQLAEKVGLANIVKYAKMLGFGSYTGVDLDSENKGSIVGRHIYKGATLNTVIGQGEVLVSPLQLANAYATIINGGKLYSPKLVMGQTTLIKDNEFNPENIEILKDALYAVINEENGTAYYSRLNGLDAAGKTGTAQKAAINKKKIKDDGWFVGYYPAKNPEIVVAVFIQDGEHGSSVAPIAFKAMQEYSQDYVSISH